MFAHAMSISAHALSCYSPRQRITLGMSVVALSLRNSVVSQSWIAWLHCCVKARRRTQVGYLVLRGWEGVYNLMIV